MEPAPDPDVASSRIGARVQSEASPAARGPDLLAREVRRRLGPTPALRHAPLVSLVVLNRDGAAHLRRLLPGLVEHTDYPWLELVVVDNDSRDESLRYLSTVDAPFPISMVVNAHNESFSDANNQGAEVAAGELLLFLNNDVEPFEEGWLRELIAALDRPGVEAVGATLIHSDERTTDRSYGYGVQHRGLRFRDEHGLVRPVLHGFGWDPLGPELGVDLEGPAVAAACVLVERSTFVRVGGFTRGYRYGAEDVDFGLKVRDSGGSVLCSGRSLIIHRPGSTRRAVAFAAQRARQLRNRRLLWERWGPRIRREYDLDRLEGGGGWAETDRRQPPIARTRAEIVALGLCLKSGPGTLELAQGVASTLARCGHPSVTVPTERELDDLRWLNYDVAVHVRGDARYSPRRGQFNVLWALPGAEVSPIERDRYDLVLTGSRVDPGRGIEPIAAAVADAVAAQVRATGFPTRIGEGERS